MKNKTLIYAGAFQVNLFPLAHLLSSLKFLTIPLNRPINEKPFYLIPMSYPASGARVPRSKRKQLDEFVVSYK